MSKKNKQRKQNKLLYTKSSSGMGLTQPGSVQEHATDPDTPALSSFDQQTQTLILWFLKADALHATLLEQGNETRAGKLEISLRRQHRRLMALHINAFEVRLDA